MKPGYYWVKPCEGDDWEPAGWNGEHWGLIGALIGDDEPFCVGDLVTPPLEQADTATA